MEATKVFITRKEAERLGLKRYFVGTPCKYGHVCERFVCNCICRDCSIQKQRTDSVKSYKNENYQKNRDTVLYNANQRYIKNKYDKCLKSRQWGKTDSARESRKKYRTKMYKIDPIYNMKKRLKASIQRAIRLIGEKKTFRTNDALGCSFDYFKIHIERQFLTEMTWDNRSKWHIDHIIPLASAKTEEDVIALNHFTNLRPMWAHDNFKKGAKMEYLL